MTKFEAARAAHNATKAKWQRARELAQQHLEERKQMQELRRSSKASTARSAEGDLEYVKEEAAAEATEETTVERAPQPMDSVTLSEFKPPDRRRTSKCSQSTRDSCQSDDHHRLLEHIGDPRRFLWKFGYFRDTQPELSIHVVEHGGSRSNWLPSSDELVYDLQCKLKSTFSRGERVGEWTVTKALSDLRGKLHDHVKKEMGSDYKTYFQDARFAHHGGLPGTTKRLDVWFKTLAKVANEGDLKNDLLALLLDHLEAPVPVTDPSLEKFRQTNVLSPVVEPMEAAPVAPQVQQAPVLKEVARHIEAEHLVVAL